MKKINPYNTATLGLALAFLLALFLPAQTDSGILGMITYPLSKIFELITQLSVHSYFGNLIAWCILILFFAAPLLVLSYQSKDIYKKVSWKYLLIIPFLILFSIIHIKGIGSSDPILFGMVQLMELNAISFSYYFMWLGVFYELFIKEDISENKNTNTTLLALNIVSFMLATSLGFKTGTALINILETGLWGWLDLGVHVFINLIVFKAIFKVYDLISKDNFTWFSDHTLKEFTTIKKLSNKVIEYAIYLTIFITLAKLLSIRVSTSLNFHFNIPVVELFVSLTLSLFISVISQSVAIKKENDQFI